LVNRLAQYALKNWRIQLNFNKKAILAKKRLPFLEFFEREDIEMAEILLSGDKVHVANSPLVHHLEEHNLRTSQPMLKGSGV
jgi:hypothetical protein